MFDSSVFTNRLQQLIKDNDKSVQNLTHDLSIKQATLYRYLKQERMPKLSLLIEIADYFQCTLGFLLGLEKTFYIYHYRKCPPFSQQLRALLSKKNIQIRKLHHDTCIPEGTIYFWLNGKFIPTVDNIMILANYFHLGVDDFLGR